MTNETMNNELPVNLKSQNSKIPNWVWNSVRFGFVILVIVIVGLVLAVANGVADPQPVGTLQWEDHFEGSVVWEKFGNGVTMGNGLEVETGSGEISGAITREDGPDFSFEAAGGQNSGEVGAAYGIVFGYQSPQQYTAVLINGNGYVEVITADDQAFMAWQQWPNILLGYEANRIRIDVQNGSGLIRINDEVLLTVPAEPGAVGVLARGSAERQVVRFGWAKYWRK